MRPSFAMLDVCGTIPADYLVGEIVLPLYLPTSKLFSCLVAMQNAKGCEYDQELYRGEMGKSRPTSCYPH